MIRLILVRHGVTAWNEDGRYQGHSDVPLGERGQAQASQIGVRLAGEALTAAYASDLSRSRTTAEIALDGRDVPLFLLPALRERFFGSWEGLRVDEIKAQDPDTWDAWTRDPLLTRPPGGETGVEVLDRVVDCYSSIVGTEPVDQSPDDWFSYRAAGPMGSSGPQRTLLFVTHGGPARALLAHLIGVETRFYWRFGIRPASVSILDVYPEGPITEVIGDTSHLREELAR